MHAAGYGCHDRTIHVAGPRQREPAKCYCRSVAVANSREFVVLLARQRSGTNALRSVLSTHPDIHCTPEVFFDRPAPDNEPLVNSNFFRFVERHPVGALRRALSAEQQNGIFGDFLAHLASLTAKRLVVLDVKYNSTHHLDAAWKFISAEPTLFGILKRRRVRVINLTRMNYLRFYLSRVKLQESRRSTVRRDQEGPGDRAVLVDVGELLRLLDLCQRENELVARSFAAYDRYFSLDYDDLFPAVEAPVAAEALEAVAAFLDVVSTFDPQPVYAKQATLSLRETIINYVEVADALMGSGFGYCLDDERMYQRQSAAQRCDDDESPSMS